MARLSRRLRIAILERDGYRCVYCSADSTADLLEVDHVLARVNGGADEPNNLVTACKSCNGGKRDNPVGVPDPLVMSRPLPTWFGERRRRQSAQRPRVSVAPAPAPARRRWPALESTEAPALRCDLCRAPATTVHIVPWVVTREPQEPQDVLFACVDHDPDGYWFDVADLVEGPPDFRPERHGERYTMLTHIEGKRDTVYVLSLLIERVEQDAPPNGSVRVHWRRCGTDVIEATVDAWQSPA